MGAVQNAVNQAIGATGVALHANDLKQKAPKAPQVNKAKIAQALDPDKNKQGAETAERVKNTLRQINAANNGLNNKIKDRIAAKELMRMK